jgi:hypothetical protein
VVIASVQATRLAMPRRAGNEPSRARLGVARSVAELDSARYQLASRLGSTRKLHLEINIALYSKLIVYKYEINNHNTTLQVI